MVGYVLRFRSARRLAALFLLGVGKWSTSFVVRDAASGVRDLTMRRNSWRSCFLMALYNIEEDSLLDRPL